MEDLKALITEAIFTHRWVLLDGYWTLGREVVEHNLNIEKVAQEIGQRAKTVHYAVELYKRYPEINSVPDGKNCSWYKICKTLPPYEKDKAKKGK